MSPPSRDLVLASFNTHSGVDGWGRPYDLRAAVEALEADVVVLQEQFVPDDPDAAPWLDLSALGGRLHSVELGRGRLYPVAAAPSRRWGPRPFFRMPRPVRLAGPALTRRRALRPAERGRLGVTGSWCLGMWTRDASAEIRILELPELRRDFVRRKAVLTRARLGTDELLVCGTHLAHLTQGSPVQIAALRRELERHGPPAALLGDMNCWGPPLLAMLPGWRRAVHGPTWPAWRPHHQIDHVLLAGTARVVRAEVLPPAGSDHRAVRASLRSEAGSSPTDEP